MGIAPSDEITVIYVRQNDPPVAVYVGSDIFPGFVFVFVLVYLLDWQFRSDASILPSPDLRWCRLSY